MVDGRDPFPSRIETRVRWLLVGLISLRPGRYQGCHHSHHRANIALFSGEADQHRKTHTICTVEQSIHMITRTLRISVLQLYSVLCYTKCIHNITYQTLALVTEFSLLILFRKQKPKYYRGCPWPKRLELGFPSEILEDIEGREPGLGLIFTRCLALSNRLWLALYSNFSKKSRKTAGIDRKESSV